MVLVAKAGDCNVDLRLAVRSRAGFGKLHRPSGICVFLRSLGWLIGPDLLSWAPPLTTSICAPDLIHSL
jgi:hypothetical protein